jgi:ribosome-associated protein
MAARELALQAVQLALEKKGGDLKLFDLRKLTSITDFFLICTGNTDTHVQAIAEHIIEQLALREIKPWHVEGRESLRWVLIDYIDVVVHVFQPDVREYYGLERLWGDAEIEEFRDEAPPPGERPGGQ